MKKLLLNTLIGLALLTCQTSFAQKTKAKFSPIKVETPARRENQQDVTNSLLLNLKRFV